MTLSWSVFSDFVEPAEAHSWNHAIEFVAAAETAAGRSRADLAALRRRVDQTLAELGGDPSADDWRPFRPLRRDREEDWSDWLAELLASSSTGVFAAALLGAYERRLPRDYVQPSVGREVSHDGHRADLILEWEDSTYTHVEVKVGDPNLEKTAETSKKVECLMAPWAKRRSDVLLLLPGQRRAWAALCSSNPEWGLRICELSWHQVAVALRRGLPSSRGESMTWRVWARTFAGAIEQELLGHRSGREPDLWAGTVSFGQLALAEELLKAVEEMT